MVYSVQSCMAINNPFGSFMVVLEVEASWIIFGPGNYIGVRIS